MLPVPPSRQSSPHSPSLITAGVPGHGSQPRAVGFPLELVEETAGPLCRTDSCTPGRAIGLGTSTRKAEPFRGVVSDAPPPAESEIRAGVDLERGRGNGLAGVCRIRKGGGDVSLRVWIPPATDYRIRNDGGIWELERRKVETRS